MSYLPTSASAIKCYQCKSLTDPNCAKDKIDSASNIRAVDCDSVPKPNTMEQLQPVTRCNKVVTSGEWNPTEFPFCIPILLLAAYAPWTQSNKLISHDVTQTE